MKHKNLENWWGAVVLWAYSSAIGTKGPGIESPWRQKKKKKILKILFGKIKQVLFKNPRKSLSLVTCLSLVIWENRPKTNTGRERELTIY